MMPVKQMNCSIVAHCSSRKLSSSSSANNCVSYVENVADRKSGPADEDNQSIEHNAPSDESCDQWDHVPLGGNNAWERESNTQQGIQSAAANEESSINSNKKSSASLVYVEEETKASTINIEDKIQEANLTQKTFGTGISHHAVGQEQKESSIVIELRGVKQSSTSSESVFAKPCIGINLKPANNMGLSQLSSSSKRSRRSAALTSKHHRRLGSAKKLSIPKTFQVSSAAVSPKRKYCGAETTTCSKRSKVQHAAELCSPSQSQTSPMPRLSSVGIDAKSCIGDNLKPPNTRLYQRKLSSKRSRRLEEFSKSSRRHGSSKNLSKQTLCQQSAIVSSKRKSQEPETISSKRSKVKHETMPTPFSSENDTASILKQYHDADLALISNLYEDLGQLGSGSFGSVNKARHRRTKKPVVLKWQLDGDTAKQEYDLMSRFRNDPNVVRSLGLLKGRYGWFIVTVDDGGHDLFTEVENKGACIEMDCADILVQVLRAIRRMHASGVMHRDIKPENVLYCENVKDENANVKLIDYGLSCEIPEGFQVLDCAGTPGYMAPEVSSGIYDSQADMYSIGSLSYFLVKGKDMADDEIDRDWSGLEPSTVGFIQNLTNADPSKRMNAAEALAHPWMAL